MLWSQVKPEDLLLSSENITADIIHSAIYAARSDIRAIIHLHSPAATAVSCLQEGFLPLAQDSAYFYNRVGRYEWDGVSDDVPEGPAITASIAPEQNTLLLDNHGFVCFGESVKEAWVLSYYFERACEVQLRVMSSGGTPKWPNPTVMQKAADTSLTNFAPGRYEWEALCKSVSFED